MSCPSGCLCDPCCAAARDFGFAQWGLDRPVATPFGIEDRLVSRSGRWFEENAPRLDVLDGNGFLYAEQRAA